MRKAPMIVIGLLILLVGGRFIYGLMKPVDDKKLIREALNEAVLASKEGRPGSVIELLSEKFKVNNQAPSQRRIIDLVKSAKPEVKLNDTDPVITGNSAQINSDVEVTGSFLGQNQSYSLKDVTFLFEKENAQEWLIFPTTKLRLRDVSFSPEQIPDFSGFSPF